MRQKPDQFDASTPLFNLIMHWLSKQLMTFRVAIVSILFLNSRIISLAAVADESAADSRSIGKSSFVLAIRVRI